MARIRKHSGRGGLGSLHVKKGTANFSNEISMSVLDSNSVKADKALGESNSGRGLARVSLFSLTPGGRPIATPNTDTSTLPQTTTEVNAIDRGVAPVVGIGGTSAADLSEIALDLSSTRLPVTGVKQPPSGKKQRRREARKQAALADPEAEIARRKTSRKHRRIIGTVVGIVASVAVVSVAAIAFLNWYDFQKSNETLLQEGFDQLQQVDDSIFNMETLYEADITTITADQVNTVLGTFDDIRNSLTGVKAKATSVKDNLQKAEDRDAAEQLQKAAEARDAMLDAMEPICQEDLYAIAAIGEVNECWQLVLQADALVREAVALVKDTTTENTEASAEKDQEALEIFESALDKLSEAEEDYSDADLSLLESYIAQRIESLGYALQSDDAIYVQDKSTAESYNDQYNASEQAAAEIAQQMPDDPAQPIYDAYEAAIAENSAAYEQARTNAGTADDYLRDYLGTGR